MEDQRPQEETNSVETTGQEQVQEQLVWHNQPALIAPFLYLVLSKLPFINWVIVLIFLPFGLLHMWSTKQFNQVARIVLSVFILGCFMDFFGPNEAEKEAEKLKELVTPTKNGTVYCVAGYIRLNLRDPESYDGVSWTEPKPLNDSTFQISHTFRAKNGFGGNNVETWTVVYTSSCNILQHWKEN